MIMISRSHCINLIVAVIQTAPLFVFLIFVVSSLYDWVCLFIVADMLSDLIYL
jgi:hypothetical protein